MSPETENFLKTLSRNLPAFLMKESGFLSPNLFPSGGTFDRPSFVFRFLSTVAVAPHYYYYIMRVEQLHVGFKTVD